MVASRGRGRAHLSGRHQAFEHQKAAPKLSTPQAHPKPLPILAVKAEANPSPSTAPKEDSRKLASHHAFRI